MGWSRTPSCWAAQYRLRGSPAGSVPGLVQPQACSCESWPSPPAVGHLRVRVARARKHALGRLLGVRVILPVCEKGAYPGGCVGGRVRPKAPCPFLVHCSPLQGCCVWFASRVSVTWPYCLPGQRVQGCLSVTALALATSDAPTTTVLSVHVRVCSQSQTRGERQQNIHNLKNKKPLLGEKPHFLVSPKMIASFFPLFYELKKKF